MTIIFLNNNKVERLKVSAIKLSFDKWMYVSNPLNSDSDGLNLYGDKMLIDIRWIYFVNDDIIEKLKNGLIVDIYMNRM